MPDHHERYYDERTGGLATHVDKYFLRILGETDCHGMTGGNKPLG